MTYTQNFSLALWANLEEKAPSGNMRSHMMFSIIHNTVGPAMDFRDNKFMPGIQGVKWYEAGVSLNPYNNWNHYAFTITNTNTIYVYVNGVKVGTQSMQYTSISKVGVLSLGGQKFSGTLYDVPKGKIANVEIFSKTMTDSEVATLASGIDVVSNFATHVYTFETDGMAYDTGASRSKWNATLGSSARIVNAN